jgi:hypothetical protein
MLGVGYGYIYRYRCDPRRHHALRQIDAKDGRRDLYKPQPVMRVRWNTNTDTPLPPDEPRMRIRPRGHHQLLLKADARDRRLEIVRRGRHAGAAVFERGP